MRFWNKLFLPLMCASTLYGAKDIQQSSISNQMRYELSNIQAEMQMLVEKVQNQEDIIEALKRDLESSKKKKDDAHIKGFANDLVELKTALNQSLIESDNRIKQLEKTVAKQNDTIDHLRSALGTLVDGIKGSDNVSDSSNFTIYEVKSGDSLGLIAKRNKVSIKALKEFNQLKSDAIFKGQKIKIPEQSP